MKSYLVLEYSIANKNENTICLALIIHLACNHKIGQAMKKKYKKEMDYVYAVINEMDRKLDRPIRDLDDVRMIMETLGKIREQEVDMELRIDPIEVFSKLL